MLPPECESAIEQLDAYRRGELPSDKLRELRGHLEACRRCYSYQLHEEALLDRLVAAARGCSCPEELRATVYRMVTKESRDN